MWNQTTAEVGSQIFFIFAPIIVSYTLEYKKQGPVVQSPISARFNSIGFIKS